ncbi:hypothetical protein [Candidatus Contubernalis alkaliaceticus]|uniref:hypothetical protein n=1 Tax=Candidatus Contubernalis alkaliaceticus TaxID=338645 RepID=UPI001F4C1CE9|nr:hypothetical protein [Candidatus Contubernalis alkalaceticus]UNC93310.1 hypothetical protein HUE98_15175 [Candidatus Contubernalis alkalaceticus]
MRDFHGLFILNTFKIVAIKKNETRPIRAKPAVQPKNMDISVGNKILHFLWSQFFTTIIFNEYY